MKGNKTYIGIFIVVLLIAFVVVYGYTQIAGRQNISAAVQYQTNLESADKAVFAIVTKDQKLSNGKNLPKGTRFLGKVQKNIDGYFEINFNEIINPDGNKENFSGSSTFGVQNLGNDIGVSSKLGKTIKTQTKSSVLGAIFSTGHDIQETPGNILPRGTVINIVVD